MATTQRAMNLSPEPDDRKQLRRAVIASTVGTTIERYDFFLPRQAAKAHFTDR